PEPGLPGPEAGPVERSERPARAVLEDDPDARDPVRLLAEEEMPDHVARAEGVRALVRRQQVLGQAAEERRNRERRLPQDGQDLGNAHAVARAARAFRAPSSTQCARSLRTR